MKLGSWAYLGAFLTSLAVAWVLTPLALRLAISRGVFDHPVGHKAHATPVPYLGGLAIIIGFSCAVVLGAALGPEERLLDLTIVIGAGLSLGALGLVDDLRGLGPWIRFGLEIAVAVVIWQAGVQVLIFENDVVNLLITIAWIVGITNAFNLLDNMDGLSAGVGAIAAAGYFVIAAVNGQYLVAGLAAALSGCSIGFLRHNFHPAKIYMGDAGSLFIGFILAVIGVKLRFEGPVQVTFIVPILVMAVPIFDTALVVVGRLAHGKNPLVGGQDHVSHRLVFIGIPVRSAVTLIYAAEISSIWVALVLTRVDRGTGFLIAGLAMSLSLLGAFLLGMVPVYESSRRKRMMLVEVKEHESEPEHGIVQ